MHHMREVVSKGAWGAFFAQDINMKVIKEDRLNYGKKILSFTKKIWIDSNVDKGIDKYLYIYMAVGYIDSI